MNDNSEIAIDATGVSKSYQKGGRSMNARPGFFSELFARIFKSKPTADRFLALDNVSFQLKRGEAIGIIGRNGAGKSTLLEVLSGVTKPDAGEVLINGKLVSILNIGTGFHPDLSGRENVYLSGRVMGMNRHQVEARFDDILAFSELEEFIDQAVKYYSNGMYLRLAFSVFTHLDADIVVFDEVLNVGDGFFRRKCERIIERLLEENKTVVIVSHSIQDLRYSVDKLMLLENGKVKIFGEFDEVLEKYFLEDKEQANTAMLDSGSPMSTQKLEEQSNNHVVEVKSIEILGGDGSNADAIVRNESIIVRWEIEKKTSGNPLYVILQIHTIDGNRVIADSHFFRERNDLVIKENGFYFLECEIPGELVNQGSYFFNTRISNEAAEILYESGTQCHVKILPRPWEATGQFSKLNVPVQPNFKWSINEFRSEPSSN